MLIFDSYKEYNGASQDAIKRARVVLIKYGLSAIENTFDMDVTSGNHIYYRVQKVKPGIKYFKLGQFLKEKTVKRYVNKQIEEFL